MKKLLAITALVTALFAAQPASAHNFWVLLNESFAHPPGHVTSLLGFGHVLPVDDLLTSEAGVIKLASYQLVGPQGTKVDLGLPDAAVQPKKQTALSLSVQSGDLGLRKIGLTGKQKPGTYQVVAQTQPMYFTMYVDKNGKKAMAPKPMDQIKNASRVLSSMKYQSYAKAFFAVKNWSKPRPMGHDLEIMPLDDLSQVRQGDLVRFNVTYKGQPVNVSMGNIQTMTCASNVFGGPDKFHLAAYIVNGEAQFRMPAAGQWVANVYYHLSVPGNHQLKQMQGKCKDIYIAGTVAFTVKP